MAKKEILVRFRLGSDMTPDHADEFIRRILGENLRKEFWDVVEKGFLGRLRVKPRKDD